MKPVLEWFKQYLQWINAGAGDIRSQRPPTSNREARGRTATAKA